MLQALLARWALKKQVKLAVFMIARDLVRKGFGRLELRFPKWKFLTYRRYLGL